MNRILPKSIDTLIEKLARLPGIGPKSAGRLTFALLHRQEAYLKELAFAIESLQKGLHPCPQCFLITDKDTVCGICQDKQRDGSIICVVEESWDVVALESSGSFKGLYHVLGGAISPLDGVGPEQLRINELLVRITQGLEIKELIVATNPSLEGEATALYITDRLKNHDIIITRIARGLPIGGSLEYADEVTLTRALEGRQVIGR